MSRVFISFVHEDQPVASAVQSLLEQELSLAKEVFLSSDGQQVYAGDDWLAKITAALAAADVVILMLSARSVSRPWVNFEAGGAWLTNKRVIPCCYGRMRKHAMPHPYSTRHGVQLPGDAHYLVESVHHHLNLKTAKPLSPVMRAVAKTVNKDAKPSHFLDDILDPYERLRSACGSLKDATPIEVFKIEDLK